MNRLNYIIFHIYFFVSSPFFPFLLGLILCIIIKSFDSIMLCDGETLDDLKDVLSKDMSKYNKIMQYYKYYDDNRWEAVNDSVRNNNKIDYLNRKASDHVRSATNILAKIRQTEYNIQKIEPSFTSSIKRQWFEVLIPKKNTFKWGP